jgi:hypothetical protein
MLSWLVERWGEGATLGVGGLLIGMAFGFFAQRSRFCLRSAVIEFSRNVTGGKLTVWLFAFASALLATQALALIGWFDAADARQIAARGSLPGAAIGGALLFGALWLAAAIWWARKQRVPVWGWAGAMGVGLAVAAAWWFTYGVVQVAFDTHPIQALSFTGPSAEVLDRVLFVGNKPPTFDLGLVPGVFIGSFVAAALCSRTQAVGAGLSGAAIFTITSWITLTSMWAAAALTDRLVDRRPNGVVPDQPMPSPRAATPAAAA